MFDLVTQNTQGSVNYAPLEPLRRSNERRERAFEVSSAHSFIREIFMDLRLRNSIERREINESARLMALLRSGKLILMQDPVYGSLVPINPKALPRKTTSDRHVHPLAQVNSTQLTSIWSLSRPRTIPRDFGNTNQSKIVQATIEQIINHYDASQMDEFFHQSESLSAMDYGTIAIQVQYDEKLNRIKQISPIIEDREEKVYDGYGYCGDCNKEGTPKDFQKYSKDGLSAQCPECGSYNISDLVPEQKVKAPMIVGAKEISQGDIAIDLVPIGSLNWDMRHLIQDSPWVHKQTEVSSYLISSMLGIEVSDEDPSFDDGLRILNAIGTRGGSVKGYGRDNLHGNYSMMPGVTVLHELWLKPEMYAGRRATENEKTVSGDMIVKGELLTDCFPDGMSAIGFNEMSVLVGLFNEKCRINSTVYHIQTNSGIGKGTTDSIEVSEHLNIAHSSAMAVIKRFAAGGGTWYDSDVMTKQQARELLKPGGLVGIKMRGTQYPSVDAALKRIEVGELGQGNLNMIAQLSNMLNIVFQTTDFTSGVANERVDINTATGQKMLEAQNIQRSAAPLRMKGFLRTKVFEEVLELFRIHIKLPKLIGSRDKYSLTKGKFITGAELPEKVFCESSPDSELPTNRLTKRENFQMMLEKMGASGIDILGLIQMNPRLAAWMAGEFEVELPIFNYTEIITVCQKRLDQVLQLAAQEEQMVALSGLGTMQDPMMLAQSVVAQLIPPITPAEDNLVIKGQVLAEYLDDDAADSWSPLQMGAVQALIMAHYQADSQFRGSLAMIEQQTQLGLQAQQFQAQQAMEKPLRDEQMAREDEQGNQAREDEVMGRVADLANEEASFDREQDAADRQASRDEEKANRDHNRSLEVEKLKLKGRKPPTKKK